MDDIAGPLTLPVIMQYVHVREQVETIELDPYATDSVVWRWCSSSSYSASTAAWADRLAWSKRTLESSGSKQTQDDYLARTVGPLLDRLQRHGLRNHGGLALFAHKATRPSTTCSLDVLTTKRSNSRVLCVGWHQFTALVGDNFVEWWLHSRKRVIKPRRKAFDSMIVLTAWSIWLQRNAESSTTAEWLP
jgi:hypothetical protein